MTFDDGFTVDCSDFQLTTIDQIASERFADEPISPPAEVTVEGSFQIERRIGEIRDVFYGDSANDRPKVEANIHTRRPYSGRPKPRTALWGARRHDIQIGSDEDRRWEEVLNRGVEVTLHFPHLQHELAPAL